MSNLKLNNYSLQSIKTNALGYFEIKKKSKFIIKHHQSTKLSKIK